VLHGETTLPVWSYFVALISGAIVTPFSTLLYARMGTGIGTNQLFKIIAGAINPGRPVANLYVGDLMSLSQVLFFKPVHLSQFTMWSHDVVATSIGLASDLKMGQYLKVSVVSFENVSRDADRVSERFLPVPCFYLKFGERLLVCPVSTVLVFGSLMLFIARGHCELWCVPWGACPQFQS
jgi:hypothetical protein